MADCPSVHALFVEVTAALALFFCFVQCLVRLFVQFLAVAGGGERRAHAHGNGLDAVFHVGELFVYGRDFLDYDVARECLVVGKHRRKFVAADAGNVVALAERALENPREFFQRGVAARVSVGVVDVLEIVHVDEEQHDRLFLFGRIPADVVEGAAVQNTRQRVVFRLDDELLFVLRLDLVNLIVCLGKILEFRRSNDIEFFVFLYGVEEILERVQHEIRNRKEDECRDDEQDEEQEAQPLEIAAQIRGVYPQVALDFVLNARDRQIAVFVYARLVNQIALAKKHVDCRIFHFLWREFLVGASDFHLPYLFRHVRDAAFHGLVAEPDGVHLYVYETFGLLNGDLQPLVRQVVYGAHSPQVVERPHTPPRHVFFLKVCRRVCRVAVHDKKPRPLGHKVCGILDSL